MYLEKYDIKKLRTKKQPSKNLELFQEFLNSGEECMILRDHNYKNVSSAYSSLRESLNRFNIHSITLVTKDNDIFLIRNKF